VALNVGLGTLAVLYGPGLLGIDPRWGTAGLTATSGCAAWIEFLLLRRALNGRIGVTGLRFADSAPLWLLALLGAGAGWGTALLLPRLGPILTGAAVLGAFGIVYLGAALLLKHPQVAALRR
jgi:putative peptidoglycan lipid II flippase